MCGIAGFVGEGSRDDLARMSAALTHRGPDGEGFHHDPQHAVFLAHRRLSIIDLETGAQPMWTADGNLGVVFNGEIYNHVELRRELEKLGHRFTTDHCDTEVLLHGYRQWGDGFVNRLNGMWAFAIYDRPRGRMLLSRDRFGKKPLFYAARSGVFAFASELSSLTKHSRIDASISSRSVKKYFAYGFIPAPSTLYERIHKLPAGCNLLLSVADLQFSVEKYWDYRIEPEEIAPDACEQLRHLLRQAVRRRLMADVPLGVFLSGGIDSSAITALAAQEADVKPIRSFSIGFDDARFDESHYAALAAEAFGTEHHVDHLTIDDAKAVLPIIGERLDEPMGDSSIVPTYLLSRTARKSVTVALGGDGGDELFAGYDPFRALRLAELYAKLVPRPVHRAVCLAAAMLPTGHGYMSFDFKLRRALRGLSHPPQLWNPVWLGPLSPAEMDDCFNERTDVEDVYSEAIALWDDGGAEHVVDRTTRFFVKLYLADDILVKVDRASMLHSLEVRSPFLDIDVADFVRRIPWQYRLRGGKGKWLLKRALAPLLPARIVHRPKQGFALPIGQWFADGSLTVDPGRRVPGQSEAFVGRMIREHREGVLDHRLFLWNQWILGRRV